ncbi:MAG: ring-cleaving dioxygenase [Mesorhizobium sp.]|uniref:ring-cleaving dioxygenase n=1 Tax=Mesorhizobium sp. TaxID=1871066 RepID=UPI000FE58127|nr:ring-cleaving dioxygenase [Mesorhizobium sp.]RWH80479.1 MAG: ring-cleaving dioxygenase [Mesorhizobium sp.]RWH83743.1 MAG: ring-cleaving dioxygenase [Mesorhizobium sp.]RWH92061.1 MAG: ring-cleaving dioxygenase [Mesorhizobium sp.]RWI00714.1 MAG: ring-cleaving dioxygenase [Mesorhizobium sp.]RWI06590.1 MAG: ring-cleaving dioxygenase [Mesorhizobium sp.]
MGLQLTGIHHLTAITANAPGNLRFYTGTLGLRLVKKTVNQDDTSAYHLFYADAEATPGTDLTFFDWPVGRERRGTNSIVRTSLRVTSPESLAWWKERLAGKTVATGEIDDVGGYPSLDFEDPEGQRLRLVSDGGKGDSHPWAQSPVPVEHQIRGLGPIVISVPDIINTETVLTRVMNMRKARDYASPDGQGQVHVFEMGAGGPAAELHVAVQPGLAPARQGAGAVHHVAFRAPDQEILHQWTARLAEFRLPSSGEVERYYFRSLYFREPNGILFEIATDGPGFTADEPLETLGERLALPPFLEPKRAAIEAGLKPLT